MADLLETKLYAPPLQRGFVPRPRLSARLEGGLATPVTLVSAPAGFGKTTLLAELAADVPAGTRVAWLSVDRGDNDAGVLWTYLVEAVDRAAPGTGARARALLEGGTAGAEPVLATLVNELQALDEDLVVILDDV